MSVSIYLTYHIAIVHLYKYLCYEKCFKTYMYQAKDKCKCCPLYFIDCIAFAAIPS